MRSEVRCQQKRNIESLNWRMQALWKVAWRKVKGNQLTGVEGDNGAEGRVRERFVDIRDSQSALVGLGIGCEAVGLGRIVVCHDRQIRQAVCFVAILLF